MTIVDARNGVSAAPDPIISRQPPEELPRGRDAARVLAAELLADFRNYANTMTKFVERLQGRVVNNVLLVETATFDATGYIARQFHTPAGAIEVTNLSAAGTAASTTTAPASTASTVPAAGAEATITVPAGETWQLQSVDLSLTTAVAVANRQLTLIIDDGTNVLAKVVASVVQAASTTVEYSYAINGVDASAVRNGVLMQELPPMTLAAGYRIRTSTASIQAADQYTALRVGYTKTTTTAATTGSNKMTVHAAGPGAAAPGAGVGVYIVPAGTTRVVPLASRQVTLYGTSGDQVSFQVYTAGPTPGVV